MDFYHLWISIIYRKHDIFPILVEIAKSAIKEKVVRVIVATFKVNRSPGGLFFLYFQFLMIIIAVAYIYI